MYHTIGIVLESNRIIVERVKIDTPNTQIHDVTPSTQIHDVTPNTQIHDT